jgi:hypothetical protein
VGPRDDLNTVAKRKIPSSCRDSNPISSSPYPSAIPAPGYSGITYIYSQRCMLQTELHSGANHGAYYVITQRTLQSNTTK